MRTALIGIGNEFRGDDGVGLTILHQLRENRLPGTISFIEESGEGTALIEHWQQYENVFLFDAVCSRSAPPGTLFIFDAIRETIPAQFFHYSTHKFSLAEAVELSRTLNSLPKRLIIYGIEGKQFQFDQQLSPEVEHRIPEVIHQVLKELLNLTSGLTI